MKAGKTIQCSALKKHCPSLNFDNKLKT